MMYVQKINRETAKRRRARFNKLRDDVRRDKLPPIPIQMFRVRGLTFLLPDAPHPDEGRMIRDYAVRTKFARELSAIAEALYQIYDRQAAGPELEKAVFDHAEMFIRQHGDTREVLTAVLDEVERNVQIPQEDQAVA